MDYDNGASSSELSSGFYVPSYEQIASLRSVLQE